MQMNLRIFMRLCNFIIVQLTQPVVGGNGTGVGKNQSAHRIGHRGVFFYTPVADMQIVVDNILVIQKSVLQIAQFLSLFAIQNIRLGNIIITRFDQNGFYTVLNGFYRNLFIFDFAFKIRRYFQCKKINRVIVVLFLTRIKRRLDRRCNFAQLKINDFSVSFYHPVHLIVPPSFFVFARMSFSHTGTTSRRLFWESGSHYNI